MSETAYIDKYKVYEEACAGCWYHGDEVGSCNLSEPCEKLVFAFASAPAANVVEVVHARWLTDKWTKWPHRECTRCRIFIPVTVEVPDPYWQYCPNCGAKMDGGENDVSG